MSARELLSKIGWLRLSRRQLLASSALWGSFGSRQVPPVAFHYQAVFSPDAAAWYSRFPVLVTGGILAPSQTALLKARGSKLVAYEWIAAFYPDDSATADERWRRVVLSRAAQWLLNASPLAGGAAAPGKRAFWYDFGAAELLAARAAHLAGLAEVSGYDGFFFDTLGFSHLPRQLREEFRRRHPGLDYEEQQGRFLEELRRALGPDKLIFLNQGYRNADVYLPHANLDLTESYMTYIEDGQTRFRSWWSQSEPWQTISVPIEKLVLPAARKYPSVRFVHLNYAAGDRQTIARALLYSYAAARLFDHGAYLVVPGQPEAERDEIYFKDLGRPRGPYQQDPVRSIAWRQFERGVVAINSGAAEARIPGLGFRLEDPPRGYVFLS